MFKGLCIFVAGAVTGMFVSREIFRKHYAELADEEIESVRETYKKKDETKKYDIDEPQEEPKENDHELKEEKIQYNHIIDENGYIHYDYSHVLPKKEETKSKKPEVPQETGYIISVEEFGDIPEYDTMTLTYYADGIVTDDVDDIVEEHNILLGDDFEEVFRDFDASTVYVRNDWMKMDYEILRDDWFYKDCHDEEVPKVEEPYKRPHQL